MVRNIEIAVRGFMAKPQVSEEEIPSRFFPSKKEKYPPYHSRVLVFDTETTVDKYQNFLFGQAWLVVNEDGHPVENNSHSTTTHIQRYFIVADDFDGVYQGKNSVQEAKGIIAAYVAEHAKDYVPCSNSIDPTVAYVWPRSVFVRDVLLPELVWQKTVLVGFNLPFDISRIADDCHVSQDGNEFIFQMLAETKQGRYPVIRIQSLDSKKAFMAIDTEWGTLPDYEKESHRGRFLDLRTAIFALTNRGTTLDYATHTLYPVDHPKTMEDGGEHGTVSTTYLEYNTTDLQATWELYCKVMTDYQSRHDTLAEKERVEIERLYSPASIGKAYFKAMGIHPFMEKNPTFSKEILGHVMSSFYAGRSEVHIRTHPIQTFHVDVHSMYPSVFVLTKLWKYVIAESVMTVNPEDPTVAKVTEIDKLLRTIQGMESLNVAISQEVRQKLASLQEEVKHLQRLPDETEATKVWMEAVELESLLQPETWQHMVGICLVRPNRDFLPARAKYGKSWNIGWNYLTSEVPLWYTIADVLAAKVITGKLPHIERVIRFYPGEPEKELKSIDMLGLGIHGEGAIGRFSPNKEDFFKTVIEARTRVKTQRDQHEKGSADYQRLDGQQEGLKILANATSYGINVELNKEETEESDYDIFSLESSQGQFEVFEKPGPFFNPIVATTITGAAHLMLAIIQKLTEEYGGDYALMDTDSSFIVDKADIGKPITQQIGNPRAIGDQVIEALRSLYPYDDDPERRLLSIEKDSLNHDPLYIYAVAAKRYATFTLQDGKVRIVEGKTHGLAFSRPSSLGKGDGRWEDQIWQRLINQAIGHKYEGNLPGWLDDTVTMPLNASTPYLYQQINRNPQDRSYAKRIKPWNFFTLAIGLGDMATDQKVIREWQAYFWKEYQATQQASLYVRVKEVTGGKMIASDHADLTGEFKNIARAFLRKRGVAVDQVAVSLGMETRDLLSALQEYRPARKQQKDFLREAEIQSNRPLPVLNSTIGRYYCQQYHAIAQGRCTNKSLCDYQATCLANRSVKPISLDQGKTWQEMTTGKAVFLDNGKASGFELGEIAVAAQGNLRFAVKTYAAILATHGRHPEIKYDDGSGNRCSSETQGILRPTEVHPTRIVVIGKETGDMLEVTTKTAMLADTPDAERESTLSVIEFTTPVISSNPSTIQGFSSAYWESLRGLLKKALKKPTAKQKEKGMEEVSVRQLAKALEINRRSLSDFLSNKTTLHPDNRVKVETWVKEHGGLGVDGYQIAYKDFGPTVREFEGGIGTVFTAIGKIGLTLLPEAKATFPEAFFSLYGVEYVRVTEALENWIDAKWTETQPNHTAELLDRLLAGIMVREGKETKRIPYAAIVAVQLRMGGHGRYVGKRRILVTEDKHHYTFSKKDNPDFEALGFIPTWKDCVQYLLNHHGLNTVSEIPSITKPPYHYVGSEISVHEIITGVSRKVIAVRLGISEREIQQRMSVQGLVKYWPNEVLELLKDMSGKPSPASRIFDEHG